MIQRLIEEIPSKIPYKNSLQSFNNYATAQLKANEAWQEILNTKRKELTEGSEFEKSREEARQTQLEQRARDAEYFNLIREGKFEEAQALLDSELQ